MKSLTRAFIMVMVLVAAMFAAPVFASSLNQADITSLNNAESVTKYTKFGWKQGAAKCVFDATGGKAIGAHGCGLTIPKNSYVTKAFYKVITTFTSADDSGTIALSVASANDIVSAVAISNGGNPWDASGLVVGIPTGALSNEIAITADSEVTATVATQALTAGKLVIFVEWVYYGDV